MLWNSCFDRGCGGTHVERRKRIIINDSGVDVVLRVSSTDIDSIYRDTITQFTHVYRIAAGDSVVSIEECVIEVTECTSDVSSQCRDIVGSFNFSVTVFKYARLIFDNRKVQVFHITAPDAGILDRKGHSYTGDNSDSDPSLSVFTYTITPEDYENAEPIDP